LTRSDRIRIKTALDFSIPHDQIIEKYGYTKAQIIGTARTRRLTPQKRGRVGKKPKITTPKRTQLEQWLLRSPSRRHIRYQHIPDIAPELELQGCGAQALSTAFKLVGYGRRIAKRKGFSDDPDVIAERLAFALEAKQWSKDRVYRQIFSDEVWASGGAHTQSYVTVKVDGSDRYSPAALQHKYSKQPAWMFHGTIVAGQKGPAVFWEKQWGSMNSEKYDREILARAQALIQASPGAGLVWMQDNASCHRSAATQENLRRRQIPYIKWPRYSPDLNLIEHVWSWMKNWIQEHYYAMYYNAAKIPVQELRGVILQAWEAVPNDFIRTLFDSWERRCEAVIDARGGPTRY
jgi:hypothetical protein